MSKWVIPPGRGVDPGVRKRNERGAHNGVGKSFAAYLPALPPHAPWLHLDARTKLPKGDYPLGREAESMGRLVVLGAFPTQLAAREETRPIFERRM